METDRKILCERCRNFFPYTEVRYVPRGKDSKIALCVKCRETFKEDVEESKKKPKTEAKNPYFCVRCRYKFKYSPDGVTALKCPYCGKDDKLVEDKVKNINDFVKNA